MPHAVAERTRVGETLAGFLEQKAQEFGDRPALFFKPGFRYQKWSYQDIWEGAGRVASLLQQRGISQGDRVLLWGPNCPQWVLSFFGCIRAGVIVVPLDLRSSQDFVETVSSKTRAKMAFVSRVTPDTHTELGLPEVMFEELEELCHGLGPPEEVDLSPDDLVEVMFTSGTTGDPKGVMLSHKNLMSDLNSTIQYVPGEPTDRLMSILPLSHMFEQMGGLFIVLRVGANVTYPTSRQPTVLFRTMRERKVTLLLLVPQALELFMKGIEREVRNQGKERLWSVLMGVARRTPFRLRRILFRQVHKKFGGSLDLIFAGGAAVDPEIGEKWGLLGVNVIQGYGATEASPVISAHPVTKPRFDSAGLPLPGVDMKIAEDGEVLLRGDNITSGYWEAPEQTDAVFEDGWYKTGDQGIIDENGFLHLKGRKKDMIVLASGQNVFPEDIEALLKKHPSLRDSVVVGLPKGADTEVHAVFIMDQPEEAPDVVSWANAQLNEHQQVRGHTVWTEEDFPRTHTLKVKKRVVVDALVGAEKPAPAAIQPAGKPQDGGVTLHRLVAEIGGLASEEIEAAKSLGGDLNLDSLKRVELLSAVEAELGVYLDESQVGADTTVQQLEEMLVAGSASPQNFKFPAWGMSLWCRIVRGAIQRSVVFPLVRMTYRVRVLDQDRVDTVKGPVMFASNHILGLDNPVLIKAMPLRWRRRMAIAGAAYLWRSPIWAVLNPLLGNGFPLAKDGPVRPSLENLGNILDRGWSVLIYPEGELTVGGPMKPFLDGTGLVAVEGKIPVVPLRVNVESMGRPSVFPFLRRGEVEVRFGEPVTFEPGTSYQDATATIEAAVRAL